MYARIAREIAESWTTLDDEAACAQLLDWLTALTARAGVPPLSAFGVTEADIPGLVGQTLEHF